MEYEELSKESLIVIRNKIDEAIKSKEEPEYIFNRYHGYVCARIHGKDCNMYAGFDESDIKNFNEGVEVTLAEISDNFGVEINTIHENNATIIKIKKVE